MQNDGQESQPCNKATLVCLRGPCIYHWAMTTRYGVDFNDGRVHIKRHRVCTKFDETDLEDAMVYFCDGWRPAPLAWIPNWLWVQLQPLARVAWERWLSRRGYNFDWRWFAFDTFEWDDPERRRFSVPGGGRLYDKWKAGQEGKTGYGAMVPDEETD